MFVYSFHIISFYRLSVGRSLQLSAISITSPPRRQAPPRSPRFYWVYVSRFTFYVLRFIRSSVRSEEHMSELQSRRDLVCRLLLEKKKKIPNHYTDTNTTPKKNTSTKHTDQI